MTIEQELTKEQNLYAIRLKKALEKIKLSDKNILPILANRLNSDIPALQKNGEDILIYWLVKNL